MADHVTVVGAGAVGVCTALCLRREGFAVRLIDRGLIGGEASRSNAAFISADDCVPQGSPALLRRLPRMLLDPLTPLAVRWRYLPRLAPWLAHFVRASSPRHVEQISSSLMSLLRRAVPAYDELTAGGDASELIRKSGLLYVYASGRAFSADQWAISLRRRRGVAMQVLNGSQVGEMEPTLGSRCAQGVFYPASAFTPNPHRLVQELANRFADAGGEIVTTQVTGIDLHQARLDRLRTSDGTYPLDRLVITAGAWSRPLTKQLGVDVPLDTERGYLMVLPHARPCPRIPFLAVDNHVAVTPTDEGIRLAGLVEFAGLNAAPDLKRTETLRKAASRYLGPIGARDAIRWMSFRPSLPDSLPVIGPLPTVPKAFVAFGHGHLGLSLAAITGKLVAEAMAGRPPSVDLMPFRPDRW